MTMIIITIISLSLAISYLILALLVVAGNQGFCNGERNYPFVSVVIAARNEGDSIAQCLYSLEQQDYPSDKCEFIIINDRSGDKTEERIENFISHKPNFKLISIRDDPQNLTGKANAMKVGIKESKGKIILSTDADCEVPASWISSMVSCFDAGTGMVAGFSLPVIDNAFSALQALDHLFLIGIASGFAGSGIPQSCIGNNIAFRRTVYDEIDGYDGIGFTITEDVGLLRKIYEDTDYGIKFTRDNTSLVSTRAAGNLKELVKQRMRWLIGGEKAGALIKSVLVLTFIVVILAMISIVSGIITGFSIWEGSILAIFLGANLAILLRNRHLLNLNTIIRWFLPYQLFFMFYTVFFGLLFLLGSQRVSWKGKIYNQE
ncbi:MAG: glycosyltransferase [candidate division Zixibacteria bacterium]|nr:glycosyltransferase [candidate division Zixibacteria bacterium]